MTKKKKEETNMVAELLIQLREIQSANLKMKILKLYIRIQFQKSNILQAVKIRFSQEYHIKIQKKI